MSAKIFWKTVALGLFSFSSITVAKPSFAVSVDLRNFTSTGDVGNVTAGQATITNAFPDGSDDGGTNYNVSGNQPVGPFLLESSLDLSAGTLGTDVAEGSAISILRNFQAGWVTRCTNNGSNISDYFTLNCEQGIGKKGDSVSYTPTPLHPYPPTPLVGKTDMIPAFLGKKPLDR